MTGIEHHYAAGDIELRILAALREAGLDPDQRLSPVTLGALDHFHTGGFQASRILQEMANICAGDRVLDIGAGLAGPARMLAVSPGCRVDCIDLCTDYCTGAALLNRLTGLDDRIGVYKGSALDLPFPDDTFEIVWMQNVGMNIADKHALYVEIHRVLKPGGCFAFQEMAAGATGVSYFPLPWATDPADNALASVEEMHRLLDASGFQVDCFEDASASQLNGTPANSTPEAAAQAQLSLSVYVDDLALKAENATRSLREGQIRFVRGVFRANK
jgi:sarcosine/dimethylglycine N-methyltransferase